MNPASISIMADNPDFTPTLVQYLETIKYLIDNNYIERLDANYPVMKFFEPEGGIDKTFFKSISVWQTSPPEIRSGEIFRNYTRYPQYYDYKQQRIMEVDGGPLRIYDTKDLITMIETLIQNNEIITQIGFSFPVSERLKYLFLYSKKNLYLHPNYIQGWCNEIDVEISSGYNEWKVMENRNEFFMDDSNVNPNFIMHLRIGYIDLLDEMDLFMDSRIYDDDDEILFFEDYCLEIKNDPEIQKILNDISEIMDTKMILGANPGFRG